MSRFSIAFFLLPTLLAVACGDPCLPTFLADTSFIPAAEDCYVDGSSSSSSSTSTSASESSTDASATGDACPMPSADVMCSAPPLEGEAWGKCSADGSCNDGMTCMTNSLGGICAPACDECGCPGDTQCTGGVCNAAKSCLPPCEAAGGCDIDGMVCDVGSKSCVWPHPAPMCENPAGSNYGPCGADDACGPGATCVTSNGASICAPFCGAAPLCPTDNCAPQSPAAACSSDWATQVCLRECSGVDTGCLSGQKCTEFGCLWPQ